MNAKYKHDCKECKFLGIFEHDDQMYDLYFCNQDGLPTVIARYGDEGYEYMSGLELSKLSIPLYEAKQRATKLNLI